jgi:hypothetical protein
MLSENNGCLKCRSTPKTTSRGNGCNIPPVEDFLDCLAWEQHICDLLEQDPEWREWYNSTASGRKTEHNPTSDERATQRDTDHTDSFGGDDSAPSVSSVSSVFLCVPSESISSIIDRTIPPNGEHLRKCLFRFVRAVKAIPELTEASTVTLRPIVEAWWAKASAKVPSLEFELVLLEFLRGWQRVRCPVGQGQLDILLSKAKAGPLPLVAMQYQDPQCRLLVALCRQLQISVGAGASWFLDCRGAARLLGLKSPDGKLLHKKAWTWLNLLEIEGVLKRVSTGSQATAKANEYLYLPSLDE